MNSSAPNYAASTFEVPQNKKKLDPRITYVLVGLIPFIAVIIGLQFVGKLKISALVPDSSDNAADRALLYIS